MFVSFLEFLENNGGVMAAIGAFGFIPLSLLAYLLAKLLGTMFSEENYKLIQTKLTIWVALCWLLGFMSQIILHFLMIAPIHSFFIYISMLLLMFIAVFTNNKMLVIYDAVKDKMNVTKLNRRR